MVIHLSTMKPNAFGGFTTSTLCQRMCLQEDGMNSTEDPKKVTCKLCLGRIAHETKLKMIKGESPQ